LLLAGCAFEAKVANTNDQFGFDASTQSPDARPDARSPTPDAFVKLCAAAYVAVPATQTASKYRRVQVQTLWATAKTDCESDGGHIVVPETATEAIAIHAFVDPLNTSPYFWAGITDPELDGQWTTVMGQPFPAIPWGMGDPDQRTGEIYVIVYSDGKFYDWFDYGTQEYACECEP
jgi:hypothetical protein